MPRGTGQEREKQALEPVTATGDPVEGYLRWLEVERKMTVISTRGKNYKLSWKLILENLRRNLKRSKDEP